MEVDSESNDDDGGRTSSPSNRRRIGSRVPKACDSCRLRKTKCNGMEPCKACATWGRRCTYRTTRTTNIQRTTDLIDRLNRAQAVFDSIQDQLPASTKSELNAIFNFNGDSKSDLNQMENPANSLPQSPQLENMVGSRGQMSSVDLKNSEFYGGFSGFAFLHKTKQFFEPDHKDHDPSEADSAHHAIIQLFDSPLPDKQALGIDTPMAYLLPTRQTASELLDLVFGRAYCLFQFLDKPDFQRNVDRIYETEPQDFDDSDHAFLPLFYVVLGLGSLFSMKQHQKHGCKGAISQAMRHFIAARNMVDISRCRDLVSIQVLICFVLFLMSTARISTSHTYVGVAITSAVRLGFHCNDYSGLTLSQFERDARLRAWWTIVKMDIYTSLVLGLPNLLSTEEFNLDRPPEGSEAMISSEYSPSSIGHTTTAASAKHSQILSITARAVQSIYPRPEGDMNGKIQSGNMLVSYSLILKVEKELDAWHESLSGLFNQENKSVTCQSISYELEMLYDFSYIVLHRPFLHYLARARSENAPDKRQLRCALVCIKAAESSIRHTNTMLHQNFLCPSSWHAVYTVFLSVVCLMFFLATQGDVPASRKIQRLAETGVRILASVSCQDTGSGRCLDVVKALATRLSHLIHLDVDRIQRETKHLCLLSELNETSKANDDRGSIRDDRSTGSSLGPPEAMATHIDGFKWPPSQQHHYAGSDHADYFPYNFETAVPGPHFPQKSFSEASGLGANPKSTIEIPSPPTFAWPFQSPPQEMGPTLKPEIDSARTSVAQQLSANDIAAFMLINPGENPFT